MKSDAAIILLNFYPPAVVGRALESIRRQDYAGSYTVYLGFHARSEAHQKAVRARSADLSMAFVEIKEDLVTDTRARDVILQYALANGDHRFLFFLDDDDEWHPDYLSIMTANCDPFVTCAKEVLNESTGVRTTVLHDVDYEGMGFRFSLWASRHLPIFVKQVSDKFILRMFQQSFPSHPQIERPLYTIHQHSDSLTYTLALGRGRPTTAISSKDILVVLPDAGTNDCIASLSAIAAALDTAPVSEEAVIRNETSCRIVLAAKASFENEFFQRAVSGRTRIALIDRAEQLSPPFRADALLLAEPKWAFSEPNAFLIPVGIPSCSSPELVQANIDAPVVQKRVCFLSADASMAYMEGALPPGWSNVETIAEAAVCVDLSAPTEGWGEAVLSAYENGKPCIAHPFSAAAQILLGTSEWLSDDLSPSHIHKLLESWSAEKTRLELTAAMPFYSRCYGAFFWRNFFLNFVQKLLDQMDGASL